MLATTVSNAVGVLQFYSRAKNYAVMRMKTGECVFADIAEINGLICSERHVVGQMVTFRLLKTKKGLRAKNVHIL